MPRDLPRHEPEKRSEQSFKEAALRMTERGIVNPHEPKPLKPGLPARTEIVGGTLAYVSQELGERAKDSFLRKSRGIELLKLSQDAAGDLAGYFNDWTATVSFKLDNATRGREPLELNNINFDVGFRALRDHLELAGRDSGFVDWLTHWNDILQQANPDPEQVKSIVTAIKEGMDFQEGLIQDFFDGVYERLKADIKAHPPVTMEPYDFENDKDLEKYAKIRMAEIREKLREDLVFAEILELPHVFQAMAFQVFTQSGRVYELQPNTKLPTKAGAVVKFMEKNSIRLTNRAEAHDLVENGTADEYYRDKHIYGSGRLDYFDLAEEGLAVWEKAVSDMNKLIGYYNNGVEAIDESAWFDTAKSINDSLKGNLSDAADSLLGEPVGMREKFSDLLTKEDHIFFFREILVGMVERHDLYTQGIPASEVDARQIVISAKSKLLDLIDKIDKRNVAPDGEITGYSIYDLASKAEAEGRLPAFWREKKKDLLSSLETKAGRSDDPVLKKEFLTLREKLKSLFTPEFDAKLDEWQKNYKALNRDAVDVAWYLYHEIKCYKLAIEQIVRESGSLASYGNFTTTIYGKFTTLLLDSILTSLANATERDV